MENFEVFISHRNEDQKIAKNLSVALKILSKFRLQVHCSEEIQGSEGWRKWIEEKIIRSNIFIFLYTTEQADWRWCMYEIGLFRGPKENREGNLIYIKNKEVVAIPSPIHHFQAYNSDERSLQQFFIDLFFDGRFTSNVRLNDELTTVNRQVLNKASEEISRLFGFHLIKQDISSPAEELEINGGQKRRLKVFISYSRKDKKYVLELVDYLENEGSTVWVDDRIVHGDRWWQTIVENIRNCDAMIVVMTSESEKTKWVEKEMMFADKEKKPIFPLLLEGDCFPYFVNMQYHDVRNGSMPPKEFIETLRRCGQ